MMEHPDPVWAQMVGGVPPCSIDVELADGDVLTLAGLSFTVIGTPGHSPGGVCYLTGNTLFADGGGHINGVAWRPEVED